MTVHTGLGPRSLRHRAAGWLYGQHRWLCGVGRRLASSPGDGRGVQVPRLALRDGVCVCVITCAYARLGVNGRVWAWL